MRLATSAAALALVCAALVAEAKVDGTPAGFVVRYPSGDAPSPEQLQNVILNPAVSAIVFEKGTHFLPSTIFVFKRSDLTLCGTTGSPSDVTIESSGNSAFQLEQAEDVQIRGLTIRVRPTSGLGGIAVNLNASPAPGVNGFVDRTTIERCTFDSYIGVQGGVRARELTVSRCAFRSAAFQAGSPLGGAGVLWEDGRDLSVTRSRFTTEAGVSALSAVFVRGAQSPQATGERARRIFLTRNTVVGDYSAGFDLVDMKDAVVAENAIRFPAAGLPLSRGRVGIVVRRAAASQATEDFVLRRNSVRRAHYGAWLVSTGASVIEGNDFHGCGSPATDGGSDPAFGDHGGAMRINLLGPTCVSSITGNDFRGLRSPAAAPAVVLLPTGDACDEAGNPGNRTDRGRAVFGGEEP